MGPRYWPSYQEIIRFYGIHRCLFRTVCALKIREIICVFFFVSLLTALLGLASEFYFGTFTPFQGRHRFGGVVFSNIQAWNCALLAISSLYFAETSRKFRVPFLVVSFGAMFSWPQPEPELPFLLALVGLASFQFMVWPRTKRAYTNNPVDPKHCSHPFDSRRSFPGPRS